jgi:hypothetical protein
MPDLDLIKQGEQGVRDPLCPRFAACYKRAIARGGSACLPSLS